MSLYRIRQKSSGLFFKKEGFTKKGESYDSMEELTKALKAISVIYDKINILISIGASKDLNIADVEPENLEILEYIETNISNVVKAK